MQRRYRGIKKQPLNGGKTCATLAKSEVKLCNRKSCFVCTDGLWGKWSQWSTCTGTCVPAYRVRHREVTQQANHCGKPANGLEDEYELCSNLQECTKDRDCQLSMWASWSPCGVHCNSIRERTRSVEQFAVNHGKPCNLAPLRQVRPCAPCVKPNADRHPCRLAPWEVWGVCSATCNGGHRFRARHILTPSVHNGEPCTAILSESKSCNPQTCPNCVDCLWGPWSSWGYCTKCGQQKYRNRGVVRYPNGCGRRCNTGDSKQVAQCGNNTCQTLRYCAWGDWTPPGKCSADCGPATRVRVRELSLLKDQPSNPLSTFFAGTENSICEGGQIALSSCSLMPSKCFTCKPVDCRFREWSDWSVPMCTQLCERSRLVETAAECGGMYCAGPLIEMKRCKKDCSVATDCQFGNWSNFSQCSIGDRQSIRTRSVIVSPRNGGLSCDGALEEVVPCPQKPPSKVNCIWAPWGIWGNCSKLCGSGFSVRTRGIETQPSHGGAPCWGNLQELDTCNADPCSGLHVLACIVGSWSSWSSCSVDHLQFRGRHILRRRAEHGPACHGALTDVRSCVASTVCEVSAWAEWDFCDKPCDGGQQQRQRELLTTPRSNVKACPTNMVDTRGCNTDPCIASLKTDCSLGDWSIWSRCSSTCGLGQCFRSRSIHQLAQGGGLGCDADLSEVQSCNIENCTLAVDCVWSEWSDWSECDCVCGGGQRSRERIIITPPLFGGSPCEPLEKAHVEPCNIHPCSRNRTVKSQWGDWDDWGEWNSHQSRLFCMWNDWEAWSECSSTCGASVKKRTRVLARRIHPIANSSNLYLGTDLLTGPADLQPKLELLHKRVRELQVRRIQELILTFVLGALCLIPGLTAAHHCYATILHAWPRNYIGYRLAPTYPVDQIALE